MNLREFNNGTVVQKGWLRPVFGNVKCANIDAEQQFINETVYTSVSDLQGTGLGPIDLMPVGVGSFQLSSDALKLGSLVKLSCKGILTALTGGILTFRLKGTSLSAGTVDILVLSITKLTDSTIKNFSLDFDICCRQSGANSILKVFGSGFITVDVGLTVESFANDAELNSIFDTQEPLSFQLTAESNSPSLNIVSQIADISI